MKTGSLELIGIDHTAKYLCYFYFESLVVHLALVGNCLQKMIKCAWFLLSEGKGKLCFPWPSVKT